MTKKINLTEKYAVLNDSTQLVAEFYFNYSDNAKVLYEVVRVKDSTPIFLDLHLDRLWNSLSLMTLFGPQRSSVISSVKALLLKNPVEENNIRISLVYDLTFLPNVLIYFIPSSYPTDAQRENGVVINSLEAIRDNPKVKIENADLRAKTDAIIAETGCYEVLLVNPNGNISEGSRSNIAFIKNNTLFTPPLDTVLGGITRQVLISLAKENGIQVVEETIPIDTLSTFEGAIIMGTSPGILPIAKIDSIDFKVNHNIIKLLTESYNNEIQKDKNNWNKACNA